MKFLSRLIGWVFVLVAILMASGEAVMALGTGTYDGLATGEMWTLLAGARPVEGVQPGDLAGTLAALLMELPAWLAVGLIGTTLVVTCRKRRHRFVCRERRLG